MHHFLKYIFPIVYIHCKCLQGITECLQVFPALSMERAVRITEKPYTPQRERLCMLWGNPVIFTDCGEIL
jgi:hypothetical protein